MLLFDPTVAGAELPRRILLFGPPATIDVELGARIGMRSCLKPDGAPGADLLLPVVGGNGPERMDGRDDGGGGGRRDLTFDVGGRGGGGMLLVLLLLGAPPPPPPPIPTAAVALFAPSLGGGGGAGGGGGGCR